MAHVKKLRMTHPFAAGGAEFPTFFQRINKNLRMTGVVLILIDGKSQTGKSTLADFILSHYDSEYTLAYKVEDIIHHLKKLREEWKSGDYERCLYRGIFWDEPQNEIPRMQFWSERNMIAQALTSSFGFLKPIMVMALPHAKGISEMIITNILFRMSMAMFETKDARFKNGYRNERVAFIKIPLFNEIKNKFYWTTVERYKVPHLPGLTDYKSHYMKAKVDNFFERQLEDWVNRIA